MDPLVKQMMRTNFKYGLCIGLAIGAGLCVVTLVFTGVFILK